MTTWRPIVQFLQAGLGVLWDRVSLQVVEPIAMWSGVSSLTWHPVVQFLQAGGGVVLDWVSLQVVEQIALWSSVSSKETTWCPIVQFLQAAAVGVSWDRVSLQVVESKHIALWSCV